MSKAVRIEWNSDVTGQYRNEKVSAMLKELAERVADTARATAPVDTGAYRGSIRVERGPSRQRVQWRVVADVEYARYVEARTGNLKKALKAHKI